jgi:hypothetical protein
MENIEFLLNLKCGVGPDGYPDVKIGIITHDPFVENVYWQGKIEGDKLVKFNADIEEGDFDLFIDFEGNPTDKLIVDKSTGMPINVGELSIVQIAIDEIQLEHNFYTKSTFYVDESEIWVDNKIQTECINFGNKGVWRLPMFIPVYLWLLENL